MYVLVVIMVNEMIQYFKMIWSYSFLLKVPTEPCFKYFIKLLQWSNGYIDVINGKVKNN